MEVASILFVGEDTCHRVPVIENAGIAVVRSECSTGSVQSALLADPLFSAITFHNDFLAPSGAVVSTARRLSPAPLVLFENPSVDCDRRLFDRVIRAPGSPAEWLRSLREAIEEARNLRHESEHLRSQSQRLRAESARSRAARNNRGPFDASGQDRG